MEGNLKLQVLLVFIILFSVAVRVLPLEMQKRIINEAINLRKIDLLIQYSGIYLGAVLSASGLKLVVNIIQTRISQKVTAQMRKDLFAHILTLPLGFFRTVQPGTVVNSLVAELAVPGNFAGMAVAVPLTNVVTLLAFAGYLIHLNLTLGLVSFAIYPIMIYVVPKLQKQVNKYNKKRVNTSRRLSSKIVESVSGIHEVQANVAFALENKKHNSIVEELKKIRIIWSSYRYAIKAASNFFINMGPFLVFLIGGYLTINGQLGLGSLVAFLSAQEKLYDPWKELIEFYQTYQDGSITYYKTMEYFDTDTPYAMAPEKRSPFVLGTGIRVNQMDLETKEGIRLLNDISLDIKPGEQVALVGFSGSGKSTLALCLAQLYQYTSGHAYIGDREISELTKEDIKKTIGLVSQSPFVFDGTIKENLMYAYTALHGEDCVLDGTCEPELDRLVHVLQQSGIFVDVLRFGLNTIIHQEAEEITPVIINIRKQFQEEFGKTVREWVEFFDEDEFLTHTGIGENIIFGAPISKEFSGENLVKNKFFLDFLHGTGLTAPLLDLGRNIVVQTVDVLQNVSHDKIFFEQTPIKMEEFNFFETLAHKIKNNQQIKQKQTTALLKLALRFSPARHSIARIPESIIPMILEGRQSFREQITKENPTAVAFFKNDQYIHSQNIFNNILFGIPKSGLSGIQEKINQQVVALLIEADYLERMIEIGMEFQVGTKGNRLSGGQRQKLAIARTFLKSPPIMILDEATSALDNSSQKRIQSVLSRQWKGRTTLIAVVHRLDIVKDYDRIAFLKAGKIAELGSYQELMDKKGYFYELVNEQR